MGPTLVEAMVQADAHQAQARKLHPFFTREPEATPEVTNSTPSEQLNAVPAFDAEPKKRQGGEPSEAQHQVPEPKKQRLDAKPDIRQSLQAPITSHFSKPVNPDLDAANHATPPERILTPPLSDVSTKVTEPIPTAAPANATQTTTPAPTEGRRTSPRNGKVLKFNPKTGTLGSPPKTPQNKPQSRIVTIKYGQDDAAKRSELARKITQVLEQPPKTGKRRGRPPKAAKDKHPFFSGKPKQQTPNEAKSTEEPKKSPPQRQTISMVTPKSPRKQRNPFATQKVVNFGGMKPVGTKVPGAMHPAWPSRGMSHVRGDDVRPVWVEEALAQRQSRKSKGQVVSIGADESVLDSVLARLDLQSVRDSLPQDDTKPSPPPRELRLPKQHFESGRKLQRRIRPQLRTLTDYQGPALDDPDMDELAGPTPRRNHPAVAHLFQMLETNLSAFDQSTCEGCGWAQKYAPTVSDRVLQAGKEAVYLRQWLETLKVQSVETGEGSKGKDKSERAPKKKRKNKLDGFVVDDDDDDDDYDELDEISEEECNWAPAGSASYPKTVIRAGRKKNASRLPNTVVLSGPHGSGKTATVYAAAKELGFEVFEINSSSRRSGKDLMERVGDMTRNHLVQRHQADGATTPDPGTDDETAKDVKSGKQGMMTAFFKPKPGTEIKTPTTTPKNKSTTEDAKQTPSKAQKQSLILLEEADILYEEDKQFWTTLMGMIAQSKRPFVITCNDESLVPIQSLNLYGILRFSPPPAELAADVCLLIAANEGHALERHAVEALYLSRGNDLRATITELNYWCQIGVGDRRGGFDWFYLRWPRGIDQDEHGDVVRVVSEKTYTRGMGWLARDVVPTTEDKHQRGEGEEEALHQCWDHWQRVLGDWHSSLDMSSCTRDMSKDASRAGRMADLEAYQTFCDVLSDVDLCSRGTFGSTLEDLIDASLPDMPAKTKEDFILGRQLLEADPIVRQTTLTNGISTSLTSLARQGLQEHTAARHEGTATSKLAPVGEDSTVAILESSFKRPGPAHLNRLDLALAFDPIAVSETGAPTTYLDPSVFDRTLKMIVLDVAPWVRSIVSYDQNLMQDRKKLSNLLSEGGQGGAKKRMRNTRAALSALEGGERRATRRERYFQGSINPVLVMRTGLDTWRDMARDVVEAEMARCPVPVEQVAPMVQPAPEAMDCTE